jgi:hypothetical protein
VIAAGGGRLVHRLYHHGACGADAAIARAAHQLGWPALAPPAAWEFHGQGRASPVLATSVLVLAFPGGSGTASLVRQARHMASRSPVPLAVVEVSPSAAL